MKVPKQIRAEEPSPENKDQTLPDPSGKAKVALWVLVALAVLAAFVMNRNGWAGKPFTPSASTTANFALFAALYVAAQVIERLMQLISPLAVWWEPWPPGTKNDAAGKAVMAACLKADRSAVMMGIASLAGVIVSCVFGLYFLAAVGINTTNSIDGFCSGIVIAAGTKPLHDFISLIQNQSTPTTGSGTTA